MRTAKTLIRLGGCPGWSKSSLGAHAILLVLSYRGSFVLHNPYTNVLMCAQWVAMDPSFLHADSEDSDQTRRMPRLIWVFDGRTLILLVLSYRGSFVLHNPYTMFQWQGSTQIWLVLAIPRAITPIYNSHLTKRCVKDVTKRRAGIRGKKLGTFWVVVLYR